MTGDPRTAGSLPTPHRLARRLGLVGAVLYGLGVTIGAGIYVLVGTATGRAGSYTALSFVIAGGLMGLTAASFAELASRMPVAAGEAEYVRRAFGSRFVAGAVGALVVLIAIIAAAAISVGAVGYLSTLVPLPRTPLIMAVVIGMGAIASLGIKESVTLAGSMTVIEVGGLLVLVGAHLLLGGDAPVRIAPVTGSGEVPLDAVLGAAVIAVFAFIGFEGLANIAEEVQHPRRTIPAAIFVTLVLTTLIYVAVVTVALDVVGADELRRAPAPLALVFERVTGAPSWLMSVVAVVATINGIVVQLIMASRVIYGLARQGTLLAAFARISPATQTPVMATAAATGLALAFALGLPLDRLADVTAHLTLGLFCVIDAALIVIKLRDGPPPEGTFTVPVWVPVAGVASTVLFLIAPVLLV
jgi:amino acid transporter